MKTRESPAPLRLSPRIQRYDWGDPSFIPTVVGLDPDGGPYAEAWYGAHPIAPAKAFALDVWMPLDEVMLASPETILGRPVYERFGRLPYLLKLLAAARPLSIQVHAGSKRARAGFALEESAGIPMDAPHRRYRDPHHKPELLVALTDFFLLCGFRPPSEILAALDELPELACLLPSVEPTPAGMRMLLSSYFALPRERLRPALFMLVKRAERALALGADDPCSPWRWALIAQRRLRGKGPPDSGLPLLFFLSIIRLSPGEAVFIPPGTPHAYLRGAGLELVASSDNVLRAGLTSKHVDAAELLRATRFRNSGAQRVLIPSRTGAEFEESYPVPAAEMALSRARLDSGRVWSLFSRGPETLLALPESRGSSVTVRCGPSKLTPSPGEACLIPDGLRYSIQARGPVTVYRASVPVAGAEASLQQSTTPNSVLSS